MTAFENHEAEATAICQLFTAHDPHAMLSHLCEDDFTNATYKTAFTVMRDRVEGGAKIRGDASLATMVRPMMKDFKGTLKSSTIVKSLKQLTQRRKLYHAVNNIALAVEDYGKNPQDILDLAMHEISEARDERVAGSKLISVKQAAESMHMGYEMRIRGDAEAVGITTGMAALDNLLTLKPGNLVSIGGRTGAGKTAFAVTMGIGMAMQGIRVCYLCKEMPSDELVCRIVAQLSGEDSRNFDRGKMTVQPEEYMNAIGRCREINDGFVIAQPKLLSDAMALATQCREKHETQVFFFDYIQQFGVPSARSPREATMKVTASLKQFAMDNRIVSIGLAQLNREAAGKNGIPIRPRIHHLQESSSIEQDSDVIMLLWNPVNEDKAICKEQEEPAEIIVNCEMGRRKVELDKLTPDGNTRCAVYIDKYRGGERARAVFGYRAPQTEFYAESQDWS